MTSSASLAAALLLLSAAACDPARGVIAVSVVTAPGDDPLADATRVRLTLSSPPATTEARRDENGGFDLALEVDAGGEAGFLDFEAFDGDGRVVAVGGTPFLPIAAVDAAVSIFVAPPDSFRASPTELPFAAGSSAIAGLPFGVLVAGGSADGAESADDIVVYNAFRHELQIGVDLPEPLAGMSAAAGQGGVVFLFGGATDRGDTDTALVFDTNVAPAGELSELDVADGLARSFEDMVALGNNRFLITGSPTAILEGTTRRVVNAGLPNTEAPAVSVEQPGGARAVVVTLADGRPGIVGDDDITPVDVPTPRTGHAATETGDGRVLWVGGGDGNATYVREALAIDPGTGAATNIDLDIDFEVRVVARRGDELIVLGAAGEAARFDATTFARLAPTVSTRTRGPSFRAAPLPTGQLAVLGGQTDDTPVPQIDLFTPALD